MKNLIAKICVVTFVLTMFITAVSFAQDTGGEKKSFHPEFQGGPEYDFRKTTWGMSIDEVKASEEKKPDDERPLEDMGSFSYSIIYLDVVFFQYITQIMYLFTDEKLTKVEMIFFKEPRSPTIQQLKSVLKRTLGVPKYDNISEKGDIHFYGWAFGDTKIVLMEYLSGRPNAVATLSFVPADTISNF